MGIIAIIGIIMGIIVGIIAIIGIIVGIAPLVLPHWYCYGHGYSPIGVAMAIGTYNGGWYLQRRRITTTDVDNYNGC